MTDLYARRKNGEEPVEYDIEAIKDILEPTYGVITYQESLMRISQVLAGFDLVEVDTLRKSVGKKDLGLLMKVGHLFVEKATALGVVSKEEAERVFENMKKSGRYAFNKCSSFDTRIMRASRDKWSKSWAPLTVEEMYKIRNDLSYAKATGHEQLRRKWKRLGNYGKGLSLCEDGRVRPNLIKDIQPAGNRPVLKITLEGGESIRVTENHKFPTPAGEIQAGRLSVGDALFVKGDYELTDFNQYKFSGMTREDLLVRKEDRTINGSKGEANWGYTDGSYTKFKEFCESTPDICANCGGTNCRIEAHHISGDRTNSEWDNLEKLCASCHKKKEYARGRTRRGEKGYPSLLIPIASIEPDGECMTYDVTMEGPNHNFAVESGIITSNSHAVSYAYNTFNTAYAKVHFPLYFFTSWLFWAKEKQDPLKEMRQLIADAKSFGIHVEPPRLVNLKPNFSIDPSNLRIQFGLADVRGIGEKAVDKMRAAAADLPRPLIEMTWYEFLTLYSNSCGAQNVRRMIEVGALRDFGDVRQRMLTEYDAWSRLTEREQTLIIGLGSPILNGDGEDVIDPARPVDNLADAIEGLLKRVVGLKKGTKKKPGEPKFAVSAQRRTTVESILDLLRNPPSKLEDSPSWITKVEEENLGIPISTSAVASADRRKANMTVEEFLAGKEPPRGELAVLVVEIQESFERVVQNGDNRGAKMGRLVVADDSGVLEDVVVFAKNWERIGHALSRTGSVVAIGGKRDWKDPKSQSFFVEEVWDA